MLAVRLGSVSPTPQFFRLSLCILHVSRLLGLYYITKRHDLLSLYLHLSRATGYGVASRRRLNRLRAEPSVYEAGSCSQTNGYKNTRATGYFTRWRNHELDCEVRIDIRRVNRARKPEGLESYTSQ